MLSIIRDYSYYVSGVWIISGIINQYWEISYVCVCVCVCVCVWVCVCVRVCVCVHVCICACMRACVHACVHGGYAHVVHCRWCFFIIHNHIIIILLFLCLNYMYMKVHVCQQNQFYFQHCGWKQSTANIQWPINNANIIQCTYTCTSCAHGHFSWDIHVQCAHYSYYILGVQNLTNSGDSQTKRYPV